MPDATASALLTAEARGLAVLQQVAALHAGKPRAAAPLLVNAIGAIRQYARREGSAAMAGELRDARLPLRIPPLPDVRDLDRAYAVRAVKGYLKALDGAAEKQEQGEAVHVPGIVNAKLELIAATEVPGAFGEERQRIEERIVRDSPALVGVLLKSWNALLDRACPVCRGLNGQLRPWGIDFEGGGQPGRQHPRCRCFVTFAPIPVVLSGERRQQRRESGVWEWVE